MRRSRRSATVGSVGNRPQKGRGEMEEMRLALARYLVQMAKEHGEEPNIELSLSYEEEVISDFLSWAEQNA